MSALLRWGLLGASGIVQEKFIPALQKSSTGVPAAIASRSIERAHGIADAFGIPRALGSYEELLDEPSIDAVYVSVPNSLHAEWIIKAIEAGKPVISEKPMVLDAAEAERVLAASERTGVPVMEGFMYRFHPQNVYLREQVASGAIGEVREVRVHFSFPLVGMMADDDIRVTDGKGAGALMDVGSYVVSAARMLFGAEPIDARGYKDTDAVLGIDVGFSGSLRFANDRFATVAWSLRGGYGAGYEVVGSEGTLSVPHGFLPGGAGMIDEAVVVHNDRFANRFVTDFGAANHFAAMVDAFGSAVLAGSAPLYGAADALGNARALDLVRAAAS